MSDAAPSPAAVASAQAAVPVPPQSPIPATNLPTVDLAQIKADLDHDFDLIKNATQWKSYKKQGDDECWVIKNDSDPVWWIRVMGEVTEGEIENGEDLLDLSLTERQPQWHHLFTGGSILATLNEADPPVELAYYRYSTPIPLVSPRESLYTKARRETRDENGKLTSLLLSYRGVDETAKLIAKTASHERITLQAAHLLERRLEGGFVYHYIQHAAPGGRLPAFMSNGPQCSTMLKEIDGVRKAMKNGIQHARRPAGKAEETKEAVNAAVAATASLTAITSESVPAEAAVSEIESTAAVPAAIATAATATATETDTPAPAPSVATTDAEAETEFAAPVAAAEPTSTATETSAAAATNAEPSTTETEVAAESTEASAFIEEDPHSHLHAVVQPLVDTPQAGDATAIAAAIAGSAAEAVDGSVADEAAAVDEDEVDNDNEPVADGSASITAETTPDAGTGQA